MGRKAEVQRALLEKLMGPEGEQAVGPALLFPSGRTDNSAVLLL